MKIAIFKVAQQIVLLVLTLINSNTLSAQAWTRVEELPETEFTCIKVLSGKMYAVSENRLYTSIDGINWQSELITTELISPISLEIFSNTIYIGTFSNGVFEKSLTPNANWSQTLMGVAISSFATHSGELYLSTFGAGVYKRVNSTWQNINYNLPTFSFNVTKILSINATLYAFAGGNGTYYSYNPVVPAWNLHYYYGTLVPGFIADDVLKTNANVVYVARGNALLRSNDQAQTWSSDTVGLLNGTNRILYEGIYSTYVLSMLFNDTNQTNYTRFQKRLSNLPLLSTWGTANELLEFYTYAISEFGNKIFLATDQGLFFKLDNTLGVPIYSPQKVRIKVYPIPAQSNEISFESNYLIDEVRVFDLNGRLVYEHPFKDKKGIINLSKKGIFIACFIMDGTIKYTTKIVVI